MKTDKKLSVPDANGVDGVAAGTLRSRRPTSEAGPYANNFNKCRDSDNKKMNSTQKAQPRRHPKIEKSQGLLRKAYANNS